MSLGHGPSSRNGTGYAEESAKHVATGCNSLVSFGQVSKAKDLRVVMPVLT